MRTSMPCRGTASGLKLSEFKSLCRLSWRTRSVALSLSVRAILWIDRFAASNHQVIWITYSHPDAQSRLTSTNSLARRFQIHIWFLYPYRIQLTLLSKRIHLCFWVTQSELFLPFPRTSRVVILKTFRILEFQRRRNPEDLITGL